MSGAELPLAIVPLILYSIEHYKEIFQPLATFCRYSEELRDFKDRLRTQKYLFHNSSLVLLRKVDGQSLLTQNSLSNHGFSYTDLARKWEKGILEEEDKLEFYLGREYNHCASIIRVIGRLLRKILDKSRNLNQDVDGITADLKGRLTLSFAKSGLLEQLDDLAKRNQEFVAVLQAVTQLEPDTDTFAPRSGGLRPDQFKPVREASFQLFEDFTSLLRCSTHTEHAANICLDTDTACLSEPQRASGARLRFTMALEFVKHQTTSTAPICLQIESSVVPQDQQLAHPTEHLPSGKRRNDDVDTKSSNADGKTRKVRFIVDAMHRKRYDKKISARCDGASAGAITIRRNDGDSNATANTAGDSNVTANTAEYCYRLATSSTLTNLCNQPQLCIHLESCCQLKIGSTDTNICLGFLQRNSSFRYLLYQDSQLMRCAKPMSLEAMLLQGSEHGPLHYLSPLERVRLTRTLALIVLQFSSTPWLRNTLRSRDLQFYHTDVDTIHTSGFDETPKLNVKFPRELTSATIATPEGLGVTKAPCPARIRNPILFGLGTIMAELSYQANLLKLRSTEDLQADFELQDFVTASRLATNASNPLGTRYGEIARKCIECDFGHGTDLANPRLSDAFQRDVIQELVGIEAALKKLYL